MFNLPPPRHTSTLPDCEVTACRRHVRFTPEHQTFRGPVRTLPLGQRRTFAASRSPGACFKSSPGFAFSYAVSPIASRRPALIKFRNSGSYTDAAAEAASGRSCLSRSKI